MQLWRVLFIYWSAVLLRDRISCPAEITRPHDSQAFDRSLTLTWPWHDLRPTYLRANSPAALTEIIESLARRFRELFLTRKSIQTGWLKTREWKTRHQVHGRIQDLKLGGVTQRSLGDGSPLVGSRSKAPVGSLGDGPRNSSSSSVNFYQHGSIASHACAGIAIAEMSVRLSVTLWYCIETLNNVNGNWKMKKHSERIRIISKSWFVHRLWAFLVVNIT